MLALTRDIKYIEHRAPQIIKFHFFLKSQQLDLSHKWNYVGFYKRRWDGGRERGRKGMNKSFAPHGNFQVIPHLLLSKSIHIILYRFTVEILRAIYTPPVLILAAGLHPLFYTILRKSLKTSMSTSLMLPSTTKISCFHVSSAYTDPVLYFTSDILRHCYTMELGWDHAIFNYWTLKRNFFNLCWLKQWSIAPSGSM